MTSSMAHRRMVGFVTAVVLGLTAALLAPGSIPQPAAAAEVVSAGPSDVLVVAPGRIGTLKMSTTTKKAKKRGWLSYDMCGWEPGPRALRLDQDGDEVFKAYPDKITKRRIRSMHAMGAVVSTRGIWAQGIGKQSERLGSSLAEMQAAYPKLRLLGTWQDYVTQEPWPVYTTGTKKKGWLDFYMDPATSTVVFVQVRTNRVAWGRPTFEC